MKKTLLHTIIKISALISLLLPVALAAQDRTALPYSAYDIRAERIRLINDAVKITWKMDTLYTGDFVVGRSEKEFSNISDVLNSKLVGTYNSSQEGIIIDRGLQTGKKYFYVVVTKEDLLKRDIKLINNVNITVTPVSLFAEPGPVESLKCEIDKTSSINVTWREAKGNFKYNIYRSKSMISSRDDLRVAEKVASTEKNSCLDTNVPDYGTYFYAVTITDQNDIEYFTPSANNNYTITGIYIKGRTLTTPLNTGAFAGQNNSIIVKWEQGHSLTGKRITGYEIYRSEEIIDSQLKLKFAKLLHIAGTSDTLYTDTSPGYGKFYYAVFARYNDGTVDISFDSNNNFTRTPVIIVTPYRVTAMETELFEGKLILKWNYTGNSGNETLSIFRSARQAEDSGMLMPDSVFATENIKTGKFTTDIPARGFYYYGLYIRDENNIVQFRKGVNISPEPLGIKDNIIADDKKDGANEPGHKEEIIPDVEPEKDKSEEPQKTIKKKDEPSRELDYIINNIFYREQYASAVKELNLFISATDNDYDRAKARLYLARSYIELENFSKSVRLLNMKDVRKFFPEESEFWSQFATSRLR